MWKLFRFPAAYSSSLRVDLGHINKIFAYKTVEGLDESMAKEIAVFSNCAWLENVRSRSELWSLAKYFQIVRSEQRVFGMVLVQDIVDSIIGTSEF